MKDIRYYLALPWHIQRSEHHDDGDYVALTVEELPGFLVASEDRDELEEMFWPALEGFLRSYIDDGEEPPLPAGARERDARIALTRAIPRLRLSPQYQNAGAEGWSFGSDATVYRDPADLQTI